MMKIAIIPNFPLSVVYGGFERQCVESIRALKRQGMDVDVLDWGKERQDCDILHLFGLDITWERIVSFTAQEKPIVISALAGSSSSWVRPQIARCFRTADMLMGHRNSRWSILSHIARRADAIVCVNAADQRAISRLHGIDPSKLWVVPNGVPNSRFHGDSRLVEKTTAICDYVLFVGSIIPRKNPLLLAEVVDALGLPGIFVGNIMSAEHEYGENFGRFVATRPNLRWIRHIDYDDPLLDAVYTGCRLFVLPSASETQPLAALEAIAAGAPVLLADKSYARAAPFGGRVLTTALNKDALSKSVWNAFSSSRPAEMGRKLEPEFSWDQSALRLIEIYESVCRSRSNKPKVL